MTRLITVVALALSLLPATGQAATIFFEDFDAENGGIAALDYGAFANFGVSDGTVDLIGNGVNDLLPGNGLYVDLDGSTNDAGVLTSTPLALGAGAYSLFFDIAGTQRREIDTALIEVFGGLSPNYVSLQLTLGADFPFTWFSLSFNLAAADTVQIRFSNNGGDNVGLLVDNVGLEGPDASQVPEPGTLGLMGAGLLVTAHRYRQRRNSRG